MDIADLRVETPPQVKKKPYDPDADDDDMDDGSEQIKKILPESALGKKKPYDPDEDDGEENLDDAEKLKAKKDSVAKVNAEISLLSSTYVITNTIDVLKSQANSGSEFTARRSVVNHDKGPSALQDPANGLSLKALNKHRRVRSEGFGSLRGEPASSSGTFSPRNLRMILESEDKGAPLSHGSRSGSLRKIQSDGATAVPAAPDHSFEKKLDDLERLQKLVMKENEELSKQVKELMKTSLSLKSELGAHGIETKIEIPVFQDTVELDLIVESSNAATRPLPTPPHRESISKPANTMTLGRNFAANNAKTLSPRKSGGTDVPLFEKLVIEVEHDSLSKQPFDAAETDSPRRASLAARLKSSLKGGTSSPRARNKSDPDNLNVKINFGLNEKDIVCTIWSEIALLEHPTNLDTVWLDRSVSKSKSIEVANWIVDQKDLGAVHEWEVNMVYGRTAKFVTDLRIITSVTSILKRLKASPDDLFDLIVFADETQLNADLLQQLLDSFPSEDVMLRLERSKEEVDGLHPVDRTFFRLCTIPSVRERLKLWIFKLNMTKEFKAAFEEIVTVDKGLKLLKNNNDVQNILYALLHVSNHINKLKSNGLTLSKFIDSMGLDKENSQEGRQLMYHTCMYLALNHPETLDFPSKAQIILKAAKIRQESLTELVKRLDDTLEAIPTYCFHSGSQDKEFQDPLKKSFKDLYMEKVPIMLGMRKQMEELTHEASKQCAFFAEQEKSWDALFKIFSHLINAMNRTYRTHAVESAAPQTPTLTHASGTTTPEVVNTPPRTPTAAGSLSRKGSHSRSKSSGGSFLFRKNSTDTMKVEF
jgi:hypothetical protein